ncbi:bifunctional riboflavin kinase/FAD synthetase, partial [bacterium]|nr:bifunctional riboflavin kinase/FAD synthetase [bacterium]
RITSKIPSFKNKSALTLGNFDGLHVGHMGIMNNLVEFASRHQCISVMITFEPHPLEFLNPGLIIPRICGLKETKRLLEPVGLDFLVQLPFTQQLASMSPEKFFTDIILSGFQPEYIIVGQDHQFGRNREGTAEFLQRICLEYGVKLVVFKQIIVDNEPVSSSRIRKVIEEGTIEECRTLLGHGLLYSGVVQRGAGRGAGLGFPTANLDLSGRIQIPTGVYVTATEHDRIWYPSVSYMGKSPTFTGDRLWLETHILADVGDIYGQEITVDILHKLRKEVRFLSREDLVKQMKKDIVIARKLAPAHTKKGEIQ